MSLQLKTGTVRIKSNGEWIPMPHIAPEKGVDYWTDEDKAAIVQDAIANIPTEAWHATVGDEIVVKNVMVKPDV